MTHFKMIGLALVMLLGLTNVQSQGMNFNANNWFTKSMDYFHFEDCSSQEKSDLTAQFYNCLNTAPESDDKNDYTKYWKSYQGYMKGMNGGNLNPSIPDFINKYNPQNKFSMSNGFQGDKEKVDKDSWPFKTCDELQEIIRCMPVLEKVKCLTENEQKFFSTMKYFFQAQSGYICSNKERISKAFEKSTCSYMKNRADIQQQCFSINAQRLSYDWKVNFEDGVMCDLLKNLKSCEEHYYDACEEQIRNYVKHSWILPLQLTPCNSSLFEPMIDALSNDKNRRKRSIYSEAADDGSELNENSLGEMFSSVMNEMQKAGSSLSRPKRSMGDFMGDFSPFGGKSKKQKTEADKSTDKDDDGFDPMGFADYNSQVNKDWSSKFNFFGGKSKKSTDKSKDKNKKKQDDDDDDDAGPMGFIGKNKKMNFDFAQKFGPMRMKRSLFDDLPGGKFDKDMNNKFNPNPFTSKKNKKTDDDSKTDDDTKADDDETNPAKKQKDINDNFFDKFSPFGGFVSRSKRSADPYDESNPDEADFDDQVDSEDKDDDQDDDNDELNKKQKEFSKKMNKKFADHYLGKVFGKKSNKTDDSDSDNDNSPFADLDKFIKERIKDQLKKEAEKKKKSKKSDDLVELKMANLVKKDDADDKDDDDEDDDAADFMKKLKKYIQDQIKKELEKEKKKKSTDDKKDDDKKDEDKKDDDKKDKKLSEREKDELQRKKEREADELERKKQREEYEKERKQDEEERKKEREQDEKERKKQREEYEKEKEKHKSSTTSSPTTIVPSSSTESSSEQPSTTTSSEQSSTTTSSVDDETTTNAPIDTTTQQSDQSATTETSESSEIDQTVTPKSEATTSADIDTPTTLNTSNN